MAQSNAAHGRKMSRKLETVAVLAVIVGLLGLASPHFFTADNLLNVVQQSAVNAVLGIGLTFVIVSGGIDLSVGSILALCSLVAADLLASGVPIPVAVAACLALGAACGALNGAITSRGGIPPFITTLGMMLVARSAGKIYSGSQPISGLPDEFRGLAGDVAGLPMAVVVVFGLYVGAHVVLTRTKLGRYTYAIGGNEQAAWLSGISIGRYKVAIYGLSGLMAGIAALMMTARLNAASPLSGEMYELYAIAAAVIGGVSLMGGEGRIVGTLIGALIMGTLANGLNLLNVPSAWEGVVVGSVLVAAVMADRARHRRGSSAGRRSVRGLAVAAAVICALGVTAYSYRLNSNVDGLRVAFIPKSAGNPFWLAMERGARESAQDHNVTLITLAPERETDVERQFQIIENVIEQQVDAIVLAPAGSREVIQAIRRANDADIPVVIVDSDIDHQVADAVGAKTRTYVGSDNGRGGSLAGAFVAEHLGGRGQVAIIEGTSGHQSTDQRKLGFEREIGSHPGISIVASQTANAQRERGYTVAENLLVGHPELDVIFAANDEMALGALEAVAAARRSDRVRVVGFDASPEAVVSIRSGRLLASVAQYPDEMGRLGVSHAVAAVNGGAIPPAVVHTKVSVVHGGNVGGATAEAEAP